MITGPTGNAGHIGHIEVGELVGEDTFGNPSALEAIASGPHTVAWARRHGFAGSTGEELAAAYAAGDEVAAQAIARTGEAVGRAIASATALLDLELVAIGGGFSHVDAGPLRPHAFRDRRALLPVRPQSAHRAVGAVVRGPADRRGGPHPPGAPAALTARRRRPGQWWPCPWSSSIRGRATTVPASAAARAVPMSTTSAHGPAAGQLVQHAHGQRAQCAEGVAEALRETAQRDRAACERVRTLMSTRLSGKRSGPSPANATQSQVAAAGTKMQAEVAQHEEGDAGVDQDADVAHPSRQQRHEQTGGDAHGRVEREQRARLGGGVPATSCRICGSHANIAYALRLEAANTTASAQAMGACQTRCMSDRDASSTSAS